MTNESLVLFAPNITVWDGYVPFLFPGSGTVSLIVC
jgi:hypothetical protein